jgi:hypothetical protein
MRTKAIMGLVIVTGVALSSASYAATQTESFTGTNASASAVSATATVTTFDNGTVSVSLTNLQSTSDAGQLVSNLQFTLSGFTTAVTATYSGTQTQALNTLSTGPVSTITSGAVQWGLTSPGVGQILLEGLTAGGTDQARKSNADGTTAGSPNGPKNELVGPVNAGANASIVGNGPHNPFINLTANWLLAVTGVTSATTISNFIFSFGTALGDNHPGSPVPLPPAALLFGTALVGMGILGRRRKNGRLAA